MICDICGKEIGSTQMRHSDGLGNFHMLCEFNEVRKLTGLPQIESVRRIKFYSGFGYIVTANGHRKEPAS